MNIARGRPGGPRGFHVKQGSLGETHQDCPLQKSGKVSRETEPPFRSVFRRGHAQLVFADMGNRFGGRDTHIVEGSLRRRQPVAHGDEQKRRNGTEEQ